MTTPPTGEIDRSIELVYAEQRDRLVGLAFLLAGSREVAEEAVHDVFAQAHDRWHTIHDVSGYLTRAVSNRVRDGQRRHYRWRRLATARERTTGQPEVDDTWHLVCGLPEAQRRVIVLHYYADLPLDEIAAIVDRPASTVRSDHRRALQRLRKALP